MLGPNDEACPVLLSTCEVNVLVLFVCCAYYNQNLSARAHTNQIDAHPYETHKRAP